MLTQIEKLAEAQRKFENLKSELTNTYNFLEKKNLKSRKNTITVVESVENDRDDDDDTQNNMTSLLRKKSLHSKDDADPQSEKNKRDGKNIAQRIIQKNKERQLKQKTYRKEHDLKLAFSEFYLSLILLQNYQTLNHTGFRKILKKHDKVNMKYVCLCFFRTVQKQKLVIR